MYQLEHHQEGGGVGVDTLYSHLYEEVTPQGGIFFLALVNGRVEFRRIQKGMKNFH